MERGWASQRVTGSTVNADGHALIDATASNSTREPVARSFVPGPLILLPDPGPGLQGETSLNAFENRRSPTSTPRFRLVRGSVQGLSG